MGTPGMKLGLLLHPEQGLDYVMEEARQADWQGYDSVWLGDHLVAGKGSWKGEPGPAGPLDAFTLMTAIGARTSRVKLAWSMLNASFRYPAMLAKMVASLDQITKGRVICSLGSGSYPEEYDMYGIPLVRNHDDRVAYLREVVELLRTLWTHPAPERTTFEGKFVQVRDLPFSPVPYQQPHPPIWLGGESDATIAVIRDLADGWVTLTRPASVTDGGAGNRIAGVLGGPEWPQRPMTIVLQSQIFVAERRDAALGEARMTLGDAFDPSGDSLNEAIVGDVDDCLERINQIEKTGVNYLRVVFDNLAQQERVSRLLLPSVHSGRRG